MKGTEVTAEQLEHAQTFLRKTQINFSAADETTADAFVMVRMGDLVRMLAWYGAIRAKSGCEIPRPIVEIKEPTFLDLEISRRSYNCLSGRWRDQGMADEAPARAVLEIGRIKQFKNFGIVSFMEVLKALVDIGISSEEIAASAFVRTAPLKWVGKACAFLKGQDLPYAATKPDDSPCLCGGRGCNRCEPQGRG